MLSLDAAFDKSPPKCTDAVRQALSKAATGMAHEATGNVLGYFNIGYQLRAGYEAQEEEYDEEGLEEGEDDEEAQDEEGLGKGIPAS